MTVAVAFKTGQGVWIASDTQLSLGGAKYETSNDEPKWTRFERVAAVVAGPVLVAQTLKDLPMGSGPTMVMESIREHTKRFVEPLRESKEPSNYGIEAMVTDGFTIWRMMPCLGVFKVAGGFAAIGSGESEAMGAMYALRVSAPPAGWDGDDVARIAVEAACHLDRGCSGLWGPVLIPR
jgi:ATP-dependent protease HslVU (ClpYQ) peptidase subunit